MSEKLTRHNVMLYEGDMERLQLMYHHRSASEVIRSLVRSHIMRVEEQLRQKEATHG